ncbi:hypothetical protein MIMGU_mgv1a0262882mg, partial [Erythranthe guttata]
NKAGKRAEPACEFRQKLDLDLEPDYNCSTARKLLTYLFFVFIIQ